MNRIPRRTFFAALLAFAGASLGAQAAVRLTGGSGPGARHPVVAADADVIAFVAMAQGRRELFTVASDGTPPVALTQGADVRVGAGTLDAWAPISISDDGETLAWWNAQGVHVTDRRTGADVVVSPTALLPMPRLDGDGSRLVFQAPVAGALEVFLVDRAGAQPPVQLTQGSGPGRRLPHLRGGRVVFQKPVGSHMEVFVHDLAAGTTSAALTSQSGGGNRHARFTPDGGAIVFEAVRGGSLQALRLDPVTGATTPIATASSCPQLPAGDADDQVVLQTLAAAPEVLLADPATAVLTNGSRGGHRLPAIDRHGQLVVWQAEDQGALEVFALRRCWPVAVTHWGTHGQPSTGVLVSFTATSRCRQTLGLHTQLPPGTFGVFAIGPQQATPLAGAPGNFLWIDPVDHTPAPVDAQGDASLWFQLVPSLLQVQVRGQFALWDPAANDLGVVTSQGFAVDFR